MRTVWALGAPDPEMEAIELLLRKAGETYGYAAAADGRRAHHGNAYSATAVVSPSGETIDTHGASIVCVECAIAGVESAIVIDHHRPGDPGYGRPPEEFLPASSIGQMLRLLSRAGNWRWLITPHEPVYCPSLGGWGIAPVGCSCADTGHRWHPGDLASARQYIADWHAPGAGHYSYGDPVLSALSTDAPQWWELDGRRVPDDIVLTAAADHCLAAAYQGECPGVDPDALMRWNVTT